MHTVRQHLRVPNTIVGRIFLWFLRRYMNHATYSLLLRGRAPKPGKKYRRGAFGGSATLPLREAKVWGVYFNVRQTVRDRARQDGHTTLASGLI